MKNYVQKWKRRLRYAKGDSINLNGKEFVWDNKTRRYGYWLSNPDGSHYFNPMTREECAQAVAIGVEKLVGEPQKLKTFAPESEVNAEMLQEERRWMEMLESVGRQILPDRRREKHITLVDAHKMPNLADCRCTIDLIQNGILVQRRFFDSNGNIEQDVDYDHQDPRKNHDKPHIHVWINTDRSRQIKYRDENDVVKKEFDRMRYDKESEDDRYDSFLGRYIFDHARDEWRRQNGIDAAYYAKYDVDDIDAAISTVKDVQALLAQGREIEVKYKNCSAFISTYADQYYIAATCDGEEYLWSGYRLDEFEDATVGPYRLKDVVDKWTIVMLF
ncbi:MAG: hypothetical protein II655_09080 [Thermoguttaceae bacterium]|nr:hypothetical protein [Thermoguttaceae bacterium]